MDTQHPDCMTSGCWYEQQGFTSCKRRASLEGARCILAQGHDQPPCVPSPGPVEHRHWQCPSCGMRGSSLAQFDSFRCVCGELMTLWPSSPPPANERSWPERSISDISATAPRYAQLFTFPSAGDSISLIDNTVHGDATNRLR